MIPQCFFLTSLSHQLLLLLFSDNSESLARTEIATLRQRTEVARHIRLSLSNQTVRSATFSWWHIVSSVPIINVFC